MLHRLMLRAHARCSCIQNRKLGRLAALGLAVAALLALPGPAAAVSGAGVGFSGYVPPKGGAVIRLERDEIVAFGDLAGVRLMSVNRTARPVELAYVLKNSKSQPIGGNREKTFRIPANSRLNAVVVIPLDQDDQQNFTLCAGQKYQSDFRVSENCFPIKVTRLK